VLGGGGSGSKPIAYLLTGPPNFVLQLYIAEFLIFSALYTSSCALVYLFRLFRYAQLAVASSSDV
jgi:hypothetical protein